MTIWYNYNRYPDLGMYIVAAFILSVMISFVVYIIWDSKRVNEHWKSVDAEYHRVIIPNNKNKYETINKLINNGWYVYKDKQTNRVMLVKKRKQEDSNGT